MFTLPHAVIEYASKRHRTPEDFKAMTADQVKQQFQANGLTFTDWSKQHGFDRNDVYRVLNGQLKCKYGKGHDIAVLLGMKPNPALEKQAA